MKRRNNKEYIKQIQKQIIELKKYIVKLENKVKELEEEIEHLNVEKRILIGMLFEEIDYEK